MRVLLLSSSFNGLSQRAFTDLRQAGHQVRTQLAGDGVDAAAIEEFQPDLVLCPFLKQRVPERIYRRYPTVIIHPGPPGDRGPSALDWAITDAAPAWGVTALQAVAEMDAGPIWGYRTFDLPADPPRKSVLYNGLVADAAAELISEVVARAADPDFRPVDPEACPAPVRGTLRPLMRQQDRTFDWSEPTEHILRRIRAADGSPGVRATIMDLPVSIFDAYPGPDLPGDPGIVLRRSQGAILVRTGDGTLWLGHLKVRDRGQPKLPATLALAGHLGHVADSTDPERGYREIAYRRSGPVGVLDFDFYNGAMSTRQCERLAGAIRHAARQDTRVLVIRGGTLNGSGIFSNGIHLNVIEAAASPAREAWDNINAIDDVSREIICCDEQLVITAVGGNAGAGGVMLALGADEVLLRDGAVLNPHYRTMGLHGSEYWTYLLPRRVGEPRAAELTTRCEPINAAEALAAGVADAIMPGAPTAFEEAVLSAAQRLARAEDYAERLERKRRQRRADEHARPLDAYRAEELAMMSRDIFDDRLGFAAARYAFVMKRPARDAAAAAARPASVA